MKFMMIVKASKDSEAGAMPGEEILSAMAAYNEELVKAGVLVDLGGLHPSSEGVRVRYSGGKQTIIDGPFAETREVIAGFWVIQVKSKEEALEWAKRAPAPHGPKAEGEIELRQFFGLEEFAPSDAVERHRQVGKELANQA